MCILIHILYSIHVMKKKWLQANPTAIGQVESGRDRAKDVGKGKAAKGTMERANRPDMHGDRDDALDDGGSSQSDKDSVADVDDAEVDLSLDPPPSCPPLALVAPRRRNVRRGYVWGSSPAFQTAPHRCRRQCGAHRIWCDLRHAPWPPPTQSCSAKKPCLAEAWPLRSASFVWSDGFSPGWIPAGGAPTSERAMLAWAGVQLSHFAEGLSLEDLDRAVGHQQ